MTQTDSLELYLANSKLKFLKKNAHASYYHSRFEGRRTASGKKFSNKSYTAAHKKLPFGTKVKVTNEANGKYVIVEITDRGPFSKAREIDLSRKAFMDIVSNKNSGSAIVTIEVLEPKK
ncbi:MAG: septal ring lytic transglycosylase RlpA family protein [Flavobacterium sp.]